MVVIAQLIGNNCCWKWALYHVYAMIELNCIVARNEQFVHMPSIFRNAGIQCGMVEFFGNCFWIRCYSSWIYSCGVSKRTFVCKCSTLRIIRGNFSSPRNTSIFIEKLLGVLHCTFAPERLTDTGALRIAPQTRSHLLTIHTHIIRLHTNNPRRCILSECTFGMQRMSTTSPLQSRTHVVNIRVLHLTDDSINVT